MTQYNSGCMSRTDFQYEEFEGLLGSFHLTLLPLKDSKIKADRENYKTAMSVLNGFAQRYKIQNPLDAVKNPRAKEGWGKPKNFNTLNIALDMMGSFCRDFGVGTGANTNDSRDRCKLGQTLLGIMDRYKLAEIGYQFIDNEKVPTSIISRDLNQADRKLVDIINQN